MDPVLTKADMYRRMALGEFGNTNPAYYDMDAWRGSDLFHRFALWGVRHTTIAGFAGTRLNVHRRDVDALVRGAFSGRDFNISPMIFQAGQVVWEGDVFRGPDGLVCSGNRHPEHGTWRTHMLRPALWERSAAQSLLWTVLNENSYDDLMNLLDTYADHVIEFSALNTCFGTMENRNAILWEVRRY